MTGQQQFFYNTTMPTLTLSRMTDPPTAKATGNAVRRSKRLGTLQRRALELVLAYPGSTANALAHAYARTLPSDTALADSRTIPRRLRELERADYLVIAGTSVDSVTGKPGVRWWPTQKAKAWMTGNV